jgi:hypothetical protein
MPCSFRIEVRTGVIGRQKFVVEKHVVFLSELVLDRSRKFNGVGRTLRRKRPKVVGEFTRADAVNNQRDAVTLYWPYRLMSGGTSSFPFCSMVPRIIRKR